jgi:hypothetical protein
MNVSIGSVSPVPSEEEAAAIAAAVTMMWPSPAAPAPRPEGNTNVGWRFSGRWWATQQVVRRSRPGF